MNYNLLEEQWIPVLGTDGIFKRIGIKEALAESRRIRQIAASNPMDRIAILRFLLALLYWCKGNPPANTEIPFDDMFPSSWFARLDQNRDCFNLLGGTTRFYQYRKDGDRPLTANYLLHEIPTGTNFWHFRHSTDEMDGLCLACCAMGLIRLPVFSTSGGRGKPPGINAKPPVYIVPVGETLAITLLLSWRQTPNLGTPAWEKPDISLPKSGEVPLLTGLTWLPRRVWLSDPQDSEATCIACGRKKRLILSSVFAPIGSTRTEEGDVGHSWRDPHVIYDYNSKSRSTAIHGRDAFDSRRDPGAGQWAGQWATILAGVLQSDAQSGVRHWIVAFSTVQNDKYLEAIEFVSPVPQASTPSDAVISALKKWQAENFKLAKAGLSSDKRPGLRHVEIASTLAAVRPHIETKVSAKAGELLSGGDAAWQKAADEYRPMMEVVARSLSPGFTTAAVQRRRQIASTLPDMRLVVEGAKITTRKRLARKEGGNG